MAMDAVWQSACLSRNDRAYGILPVPGANRVLW